MTYPVCSVPGLVMLGPLTKETALVPPSHRVALAPLYGNELAKLFIPAPFYNETTNKL